MKRTQPPRRTHRTLGNNRIDDAWSSSSEMADYGGLPAKESQIGQRFHVSRSRRKWLSMLEKCTAGFLWWICVKLFESILFLSCFGFCFHLMNQREVLTTFPTIQNHRARPNLAAIIKNRHLPYKSGACLRRGGFACLKRAPISARMFDFYCYTNNPQAFTSAAAKLEHFWSTPTHPLLSRTKDLGASIFRVIIIVIFYFNVGDSSCWNLRLLPARALCVCGWHWAVL